jgi:hypothetical protein
VFDAPAVVVPDAGDVVDLTGPFMFTAHVAGFFGEPSGDPLFELATGAGTGAGDAAAGRQRTGGSVDPRTAGREVAPVSGALCAARSSSPAASARAESVRLAGPWQ